ncbi:hypothetical protein L484_003591 [Morus notabilis]|uniref:Uncharacterized protein n=1 Tax=Morus notabilis TaxID=981085 RepID=W9RVW3_9ROSA|nr:hypothetical protein L484_003591 [Morus notabilis]
MNWLRKMRRAWIAVFSPFRHPKSSTGRSSSCSSESSGLVKLQDDVEMCGYEDVRTMWDILRKTQIRSQTTSDCVNSHRPKRQPMIADGNSNTNLCQPAAACAFTLFNFGHTIDPVVLPPSLILH